MAKTTTTAVRSQLLPVKDTQLILPNVAVAEVTGYTQPESVEGKPEWYLGQMSWRSRTIPVVSFEGLNAQSIPDYQQRSRIAVLNAVHGHKGLEFYALVVQGIPHLVSVDEGSIKNAKAKADSPAVGANVEINGIPAVIPDLEAIEKQLKAAI